MASKGAPSSDGRRRRGEGNRAKIVAAMLALVRDGEYAPNAEQVAKRAEVSLRTVFRHFEDMESLYSEIGAPVELDLRQLAARPFTGDTWQERVVELVRRRAEGFEIFTPYRRAADVHRHRSSGLETENQRFAFALRAILIQQLPSDLQQDWRLEALDLLLSIEAWMRLRREQNLSLDTACAVLESAVRRLIEA